MPACPRHGPDGFGCNTLTGYITGDKAIGYSGRLFYRYDRDAQGAYRLNDDSTNRKICRIPSRTGLLKANWHNCR
ncbi:MAG: hypothetical protein R2857_04170 [Vampirovibrionales bacterium]